MPIAVAAYVLALLPAPWLTTPVRAQTVAPSQVVPRDITPPAPAPTVIAPVPPAPPPPHTAAATVPVAIGAVELVGGFAEMAAANAAFVSRLAGGTVTVAQLAAATRALESDYAARGFVFARVVLPPQRLAAGGTVRIEVIDGFVEAADVAAVPEAARAIVTRRLRGLIDRRHLTQAELERALLMADDVPGLTLRSTLAPGERPGGVRLIVDGRLDRVQARIGIDNRLPAALGRWQWNSSLAANGLLGVGEQIYLFGGTAADVGERLRLAVVGGGATVPLTDAGTSFTGEFLHARTRPDPSPGVPATLGRYTRAQLALAQPLARTRRHTLDVRLALDLVAQTLSVPEFGTMLSRDRYAALRGGLSWQDLDDRTTRSLGITLGQGLGGRASSALLPFSRAGAANGFTLVQGNARFATALGGGAVLSLTARAQTSLGRPLFLSEQFALAADNAVSTFAAGSFNVDSGTTTRVELGLPTLARTRAVLNPYLFLATGVGTIERASAVERRVLRAGGAGAGARFALADLFGAGRGTLNLAVEAGRQFSDVARRRDGNRINLTLSLGL